MARRRHHRPIAGGLMLSAFAALWAAGAESQSPAARPDPRVRFHHAHFVVGDPSAAMNDAVKATGGVRVVVPGLGVGVRWDGRYLIFDRLADGQDAPHGQSPVAAFDAAVSDLRAWGVALDSDTAAPPAVLSAFRELPLDHLGFSAADFDGVVAGIMARGVRVRLRRDGSVTFEGAGGLIEIVRDSDRPDTFWCPMHPDVRSPDEGRCPLCGMELVAIPPPKLGEYRLDVQLQRLAGSGRISGLRFAVREPDGSQPVRRFETVHERRFHLFIVGSDLEYFAHVHPDETRDGSFVLKHDLPAGEYMLIADFLPAGGTPQMVQRAIISGEASSALPRTPRIAAVADRTQTAVADGLKVTLEVADARPGREAPMTFTVQDAATGAPVQDLQPYLGAPAHMVVVRADLADVIHAHPEEQATSGPTVTFHPLIPSAGDYKLWIQFQRGGRVITVPFLFRTTP